MFTFEALYLKTKAEQIIILKNYITNVCTGCNVRLSSWANFWWKSIINCSQSKLVKCFVLCFILNIWWINMKGLCNHLGFPMLLEVHVSLDFTVIKASLCNHYAVFYRTKFPCGWNSPCLAFFMAEIRILFWSVLHHGLCDHKGGQKSLPSAYICFKDLFAAHIEMARKPREQRKNAAL